MAGGVYRKMDAQNIKVLPTKQPKSSQAMIDFLREYIDIASTEQIVYLEITYKRFGDRTIYSDVMTP